METDCSFCRQTSFCYAHLSRDPTGAGARDISVSKLRLAGVSVHRVEDVAELLWVGGCSCTAFT